MNFDQLNEHSLEIFKRGCIKHVFQRVKESVQEYASDISEAQYCVDLVEKWLKDEASVSSEDLREAAAAAADAADAADAWSAAAWSAAVDAAAWSADAVAWSAVADAAWSADAVADAAWSADAAAYAVAWSASAAAAVWQKAKGVEKEWQQRFFNILLRQQQKMKQMRENKIQYSREFKDLQDCEVVSILRFNIAEENKYPHGLLQSLYRYANGSEHLLYMYIKQMRNMLTDAD